MVMCGEPTQVYQAAVRLPEFRWRENLRFSAVSGCIILPEVRRVFKITSERSLCLCSQVQIFHF